MSARIRIATRRSKLALWQTGHIAALLARHHPGIDIEVIEATTIGDDVRDRSLAEIGGTGLFTKELERLLLDERADIAVHSLKDMETTLPEGLELVAVPERAAPHDVCVSQSGVALRELPAGATIGTSSLRRRAQLGRLRPDLNFSNLRGNVPTRLRKVLDGEAGCDATILARAGLERLSLFDDGFDVLPFADMVPAVGQGALGIEGRVGDTAVRELINVLEHAPTRAAVDAERAWLRELGGGCQVPAGAIATVDGDSLAIDGVICSLDGSQVFRDGDRGLMADAAAIGLRLARSLVDSGAGDVVETVRSSLPGPGA